MGMGVSIKQQLRRAQRERDEHRAAAIVFYQIACDLCGVLAVKAEYERRLVKPDDQENASADESTILRHQASDGRIDSEASKLAKTDNGVGVTLPGGESGLPDHTFSLLPLYEAPGPIVHNHIEANGEVVVFGGAAPL